MAVDPVQKTLILKGLGCANCAAKIEKEVRLLPEIVNAHLDFVSSKITFQVTGQEQVSTVVTGIEKIVSRIEHGVEIIDTDRNDMTCSPETNTEQGKQSGAWARRFRGFAEHISWQKGIALILGVLIFLLALIGKTLFEIELLLFLAGYFLIGYEVITKAVRNILRGELFDENFLMFIATVGAFAIGEYPEAVAVMLFYQIGEFFQDMAVHRSRKSISDLMDIRPDYANLKEGVLERKVPPQAVREGQIIIVKPGEKVPLDGIVTEGRSVMDTSALTGEFVPREVQAGSNILAGFINTSGLLQVEVTKRYEQSTVARILDMVENAGAKKAPTENFITKFARYYTPAVVVAAALLAFVPPLVVPGAGFSEWINRALVFLVVSCPCALVISIPLSFFGGIGGASRNGILIKGSNYLEALNRVKTVVFDKTGTLTEGVFDVVSITPNAGYDIGYVMANAALAESYSSHPIALSILRSYGQAVDTSIVSNYQESPGHGVKALVRGKEVIAGSARMLKAENIDFEKVAEQGTVVYIAVDKTVIGHILIADRIRQDAPGALEGLKELGIKKIVMLTGDTREISEEIAGKLGFDQVYAELLPDQKVEIMEKLEREKDPRTKLAFIGDGINDAPVLARSDIGIAMGGLGSDAAIEAADIVLMTDEPAKIVTAVKIAQRTRAIVWQNIFFALGIKGAVLLLGALGLATMWEAVFADVGVAVIAILNAMRVLKTGDFSKQQG